MRRRNFFGVAAALIPLGMLAAPRATVATKPKLMTDPVDIEYCDEKGKWRIPEKKRLVYPPKSRYLGEITQTNITTDVWTKSNWPTETTVKLSSATGEARFTAFNYEHRHNPELYSKLNRFCEEIDATADTPTESPFPRGYGIVTVAGIEFKISSYRITAKPM